jgi:hypothetical protein
MADLNFNPDTVPDDDFLCPTGDGTAQVIKSEIEELPDSRGSILQLTYEFMTGPLTRRHAREGFLVRDGNGQNGQWKEISDKSLKKLCSAVGHTGPLTKSEQLHFKPFHLVVGSRTDKNGKDRNTFTHKPVGALNPAVAGGTAPPAAAAAMPWAASAQ